jgi:hypothetical protein
LTVTGQLIAPVYAVIGGLHRIAEKNSYTGQ